MKKLIAGLIASAFVAGASYGAQNYAKPAGAVTWTNTTGANVESGAIVDLGDRYGVAAADITSNTIGEVFTEGQWRFNRAVTNATTHGQKMYYSNATSVTTVATADTYIGTAVDALANLSQSDFTNNVNNVIVDLNAPQRQIIVSTDVQAYDADLATIAAQGLGYTTNSVALTNGILISVTNGLIESIN